MKTRGVLNTETSDHGPPPHGGSAVMYPRAKLPLAPTDNACITELTNGAAPHQQGQSK